MSHLNAYIKGPPQRDEPSLDFDLEAVLQDDDDAFRQPPELPHIRTEETEMTPPQFVTATLLDDVSTIDNDTIGGIVRSWELATGPVDLDETIPSDDPSPTGAANPSKSGSSESNTCIGCLVRCLPRMGRGGAPAEPRRAARRRGQWIKYILVIGPILMATVVLGLIIGLLRMRKNNISNSSNEATLASPGAPISFPSQSKNPTLSPTLTPAPTRATTMSPNLRPPTTAATEQPSDADGNRTPSPTDSGIGTVTPSPITIIRRPTPEPGPEPTPEPTPKPAPEPAPQPTPRPTNRPTPRPTNRPTEPPYDPIEDDGKTALFGGETTEPQTEEPTAAPTKPTPTPTEAPTETKPTPYPTLEPIESTPHSTLTPTESTSTPTPTAEPTETKPTPYPTMEPTESTSTPTPTEEPNEEYTPAPTEEPTEPTPSPTPHPTIAVTSYPTRAPTPDPTTEATYEDTPEVTDEATDEHTTEETDEPTEATTSGHTYDDAGPQPPPSSGSSGIPYPDFRFTPWGGLDDATLDLALLLAYDHNDWNKPGKNSLEDLSFVSIGLDRSKKELDAIIEMGFTEMSWDCWVNHFWDWEWSELCHRGLDGAFTTLGWTRSKWEGEDSSDPDSEYKDWDELSGEEQKAAKKLCYNQNLWDHVPISKW